MYYNTVDFSNALQYSEKSLEIREKTSPSNHLAFAISYNNIDLVYHRTRCYSKAFEYCEKDLEITEIALH